MPRYATQTTVSVEKSKAEIEGALMKYGAEQFLSGWDSARSVATLQFRANGRHVRIMLPLPKAADYVGKVKPRFIDTHVAQENRQRWRALLLIVKAKLEAVDCKVATFEQEFMPYIVMPDGKTVGDRIIPQIEKAYREGKGSSPLLLGE